MFPQRSYLFLHMVYSTLVLCAHISSFTLYFPRLNLTFFFFYNFQLNIPSQVPLFPLTPHAPPFLPDIKCISFSPLPSVSLYFYLLISTFFPWWPALPLSGSPVFTLDVLTDDVETHKVAHLGLRGHLTLVSAVVAFLHVLHLQRPRLWVRFVPRLEPLVGDESVVVDGEDMWVSGPDPRCLREEGHDVRACDASAECWWEARRKTEDLRLDTIRVLFSYFCVLLNPVSSLSFLTINIFTWSELAFSYEC